MGPGSQVEGEVEVQAFTTCWTLEIRLKLKPKPVPRIILERSGLRVATRLGVRGQGRQPND